MKSKFDTLPHQECGLPHEQCITNYLEYLTSDAPNKCYDRYDFKVLVAKEFDIPTFLQEATGNSPLTLFATSISWVIRNAQIGERNAQHIFLKRVNYGIYQHVSGNGELDLEMRERLRKRIPVRLSKKLVEECRVSVRLLKGLKVPHGPEEIMIELDGRIWPDDVIEAAIKTEFAILS